MNFIEGTVVEEEGNYYFDAGIFKLKLSKELGELISEKASEVILGIRPEHIGLSLKEEPNSIKGSVYVVEPLGRDLIVNVKIGDTIIKVVTSPSIKVVPGMDIWLIIKEEKMHFFDKRSEKAII